MSFSFRDDIATADIAFEAIGSSWSELFQQAGLATEASMVELQDLKQDTHYDFQLKANTIDQLLFQFLEDLIYLKDVEGLLFSQFDLEVREEKDMMILHGTGTGEKRDLKHHRLHMDVKAVTYHMFEVRKRGSGDYFARVVLDI